MTGYGAHIFPQHAALLEASAITPEVARDRGYVTIDVKKRLEELGFGRYQRNVPGLLIPLRRADGSVWGYQYRPDSPRQTRAGRVVKYETPKSQRNGIDVPAAIKDMLGDPSVPLWVTEGSRKADAAVSAGLACVSMAGVWAWRGRNAKGGKLAVADWHDIALNGRRVVLAFDSDVIRKPKVQHALSELAGYLETRDAKTEYLHLAHEGDGKTGLDDHIAAHGADGLWELVRPDLPAVQAMLPEAAPSASTTQQDTPAWDGDPGALLDEAAAFLAGYVVFPSAHAAVAVTLWAAHTHLVGQFESTPRLALLSPEKQCGKSRVLELLELLCAGAETLSDASPAYLYRRIGAGQATILLDEADAIWKRGKTDETAEALRSIVNAGHRRTATVGRVEMNGQAAKLTRFKVYAPAAIAGIGSLPDTIMDRAVVVRMRRRAPDERVRDYRERVTRPEGEALRDQLAAWAATVAGRVGDPWPDMPAGVADRPADVWEPLLMVAGLAGGGWPDLAREACVSFVTGSRDDTASLGTRLLEDLRAVWPSSGTDGTSGTVLASHVPDVPSVPHLGTEDLLRKLHAIEEAPWGDWYGHPLNPRDLARLLKPYGVNSAKVRIGEQSVRGYRAADLWDVWQRYAPAAQPVSAVASVSALASTDTADTADTRIRQTCAACGQTMTVIEDGQTTHPMCGWPEGTLGETAQP